MSDLKENVGYQERARRARRMHAIIQKLLKARELHANKFASAQKIKERSEKLARMMLRKKIAGISGKDYVTLNTSRKIQIDKLVDSLPKQRRQLLAKRLVPYVIKAEQARLQSLRAKKTPKKTGITEELILEITAKEKLRRTAASQRSKHKRKHAKAHSRPTRPHERTGELRAASRARVRAKEQELYPGINPKSKYGKLAMQMMRGLTKKKPGRFTKTRIKQTDLSRISLPGKNPMSPGKVDRRTLFQDFDYDFAEILIERNDDRLNKLFLRGLVDRDKIEHYKRIFNNLKTNVRYRRYQDDIVDLMDTLVDIITKDNPIYQRVRHKLASNKSIREEKGAEKPSYHKGLDPETKEKRIAAFRKGAKKHHSDPTAYPDDHPGDKGAKKKKSKYTKKAEKMGLAGKALSEAVNVALKKKSEKSGIPYSILKQVYNRGLAAWRTGHRPGATQQQWGYARVNSFLTGGKTRTTADKDLWKKASASRKKKNG